MGAHPQFAIVEQTRVLLPETIDRLLCVYGGQSLETMGTYDVPSLSLINPVVTGDGKKFYYPGKVAIGRSGLHEQASGNYLMLTVPQHKVPYLGVWIDEGMYNDRVTCALEPGIGYFDSLSAAIANGTAQIVDPHGSFEWSLTVALGNESGFMEM